MESNTLTVTGNAEIPAEPDTAQIVFGVTTFDRRVKEGSQAHTALTQQVISALKQQDVPDEGIRTGNYRIHQRYEDRPGRRPIVVGYDINNQVYATLHNLDKVGETIDAVLDVGGITVLGIHFGRKDRTAIETRALQEAVTDAKYVAETLAQASGVRITGILTIDEHRSLSNSNELPMEGLYARAGAPDSPTPILPGELTVSVSVTICYSIAP